MSAIKEALAPEKPISPYIVSKRNPIQFNSKISPVVNEVNDCVYIASGNIISVYSLTTGILISTLRSKRQAGTSLKGDVHKGNIIALSLIDNNVREILS